MPVPFSTNNSKIAYADYILNNADRALICIAPEKTDNEATIDGKTIAETTVVSGDFFKTFEGANLRLTSNAKSGVDNTAPALVTDDIYLVLVKDSPFEMLLCQDATDRIIPDETGDTITIPGCNHLIQESA